MTATISYICNWCGEPPDEPMLVLRESGPPPVPTGWWPVPGVGPNGAVGHCCPRCFTTGAAADVRSARAEAANTTIARSESAHAETAAGTGVDPVPAPAEREALPGSPWTRGASPFGENAGAEHG